MGRLTPYQRERRFLRDVLAGTGAYEAWTPSLLGPEDHERAGLTGASSSALHLTNPLSPEESVLRRSLRPGMLKALAFNASRRESRIRLFEIGHVFPPPSDERLQSVMQHANAELTVVDEREMMGMLLAVDGDDASEAVRRWHTIVEALHLQSVEMEMREDVPGMHPSRTAQLTSGGVVLGVVGEIDPAVLGAFGIEGVERVGWLEADVGALLGEVPRRPEVSAPVSQFPPNDIDLAFMVADSVPAASVSATLQASAGGLLESIELFDVYRGSAVPTGSRSLAWHLRFSTLDHTVTDEEVGAFRAKCIEAVERSHGAELRG